MNTYFNFIEYHCILVINWLMDTCYFLYYFFYISDFLPHSQVIHL